MFNRGDTMERNGQEKIFLNEYTREKARNQYLKDNTKSTSSRYKLVINMITLGAVPIIFISLLVNFSEALGFQYTNILDGTLLIPMLIIAAVFYVLSVALHKIFQLM
jgi:hypothetical protein